MKYFYNTIAFLILAFTGASCVDDPLVEGPSSTGDFNIKEFSDGYSLCFNVTLDPLGGGMITRATEEDAMLEKYENYLDPEEYRVLFFDEQDRFLFESKTRWFTEVDSKNGNRTWRIGVPVFGYLSDNYDDNNGGENDAIVIEDYNWDRIVEIMRSQPFKIAVLANRPTEVRVPDLSDWNDDPRFEELTKNFAKNGPFWNSTNSIANYDLNKKTEKENAEKNVTKVFDLHHCQEDPLYFNKCFRNIENKFTYQGHYDFLMDWSHEKTFSEGEPLDIPWMGAVSGWISLNRGRKVYNPDSGTDTTSSVGKPRIIRYYRLPHDMVDDQYHKPDVNLNFKPKEIGGSMPEGNLYIPMYGIQKFEPLEKWSKGTTFNVSTQSGSQTGEYDYKSIFLLRSVVKLELRIPMYDGEDYVDVDNTWAQIMLNNYMARCEPMDVSTPTNEIWENDHVNNCEWLNIKRYGLLHNGKGGSFKTRLAWFYGLWKEKGWWNFEPYDAVKITDPDIKEEFDINNFPSNHPEYPKIFNPITQRTQFTLITDCYLPIISENKRQCYHRWVIYCGERNMNDLNYLGDMTPNNKGYIAGFRIPVCKRKMNENGEKGGKLPDSDCIYNIPITDYTQADNPAKKYFIEKEKNGEEKIKKNRYYAVRNVPDSWIDYCDEILKTTNENLYPFPLLRNHFYRLTVSFGDNEDINVQVMDSEKRIVGGIVFN